MARTDLTHDEINLSRLLRRLEKSIASREDWKESPEQTLLDLWFRSQGGLQKVKYARTLAHSLELADEDKTREARERLSDTKTKLDRCEAFFTSVAESSKPKPTKGHSSLLAALPIPEDDIPKASDADTHEADTTVDQESVRSSSPPPYSPSPSTGTTSRPTLNTNGLLISPPQHDAEMSPTLITSLLLGADDKEDANSAYAKARATTTARQTADSTLKATSGHRHGTAALHEELSSQLEAMAAQLKRNAIYTSTSLAKDRAVVKGLGEKLEVNHDVMTKERQRLRDHSGKSGGTTWLSVGIVFLVVLLFVVMVGVIRFSRF